MSVDEGSYRAETSIASLAPALALQISKSPVGRSLKTKTSFSMQNYHIAQFVCHLAMLEGFDIF